MSVNVYNWLEVRTPRYLKKMIICGECKKEEGLVGKIVDNKVLKKSWVRQWFCGCEEERVA